MGPSIDSDEQSKGMMKPAHDHSPKENPILRNAHPRIRVDLIPEVRLMAARGARRAMGTKSAEGRFSFRPVLFWALLSLIAFFLYLLLG